MTNPDEVIERVLTELRDVDVPAGMERRVLRMVQERAVAPAASAWWKGARALVWYGAGLAALVLLAGGVAGVHRQRIAPVRPAIARTPVGQERLKTLERVAAAQPLRQSHAGAGRKNVVRHRDADSTAVSEMRAVSMPAPPEPLTDQERLLLRIVHRNDPVELAMLDPVVRAARRAEEKKQVEMFFEPTVKKENN